MGKLTERMVERMKPGAKPSEVPDGAGLYLSIRPNGGKSFNLRYRFGGKPRNLTIGPASIGLAAARQRAREELVALGRGIDPATEKAERRAAQIAANTPAGAPRDLVENVVGEFVARYAKTETRRWRETERLLQKDVVPAWRGRRLSTITKTDIHDLLDAIRDRGSPIVANRVFAHLRKMLSWAVERGLLETNPAEKIKKPVSEKSRERVLTDAELAAVWQVSERLGFPFAPIVQLLVLTGARRAEVAGMSRKEIDLGAKLWTLPAERSKNGRKHVVPLAPRAIH